MKLNALGYTIAFLIYCIGQCQSSIEQKLQSELNASTQDTARITILLSLTKENVNRPAAVKWAKKASEIAKNQNHPLYLAKAKESLGIAYNKEYPDSAKILLRASIKLYKSVKYERGVASATRALGRVFEEIGSYDSAYYYFKRALIHASESNYLEGMGDAYYCLGRIDNLKGNNASALKNSSQALESYKRAGMAREMGQTLNQIGIVYDIMGLYPEAIENYLKAKEIAEETKDLEDQIILANNLGVIYGDMNNPSQSLKYYNEAMEMSRLVDNNTGGQALLLNNISYIHLSSGDTLEALRSLWQSIKLINDGKIRCLESYPKEGLIDIYINTGKLDSAEYYLNESLKVSSECEDVAALTTLYKDQGKLLALRKNIQGAHKSLIKSLQLSYSANLSSDSQELLYELYQLHKSAGNKELALNYLESFQHFADSVNISKSEERAAQLMAEYDFRKQVEQMEIERKSSEDALQMEIESQQREFLIILIGMILLGMFALILGRFYLVIQKNNKNLKWLNEEKNTLMGVVAHDLRNPLNMIKGLMGLIQETKGTLTEEELDQYHGLISSTTDKMSDMINRVLDITAIENMKVNLNMIKTDLTKSLTKASENFNQIAKQKKITIINQFDPTVHQHALVDPRYLDQILDNLISNAIKFSTPGKSIKLKVNTVEHGYKTISIADEGPGISQADQERMFQKFTKLKARPTSDEKSTGLGLSIVQKYVSAMDGEILCKSELEVGTTFEIKFKPA